VGRGCRDPGLANPLQEANPVLVRRKRGPPRPSLSLSRGLRDTAAEHGRFAGGRVVGAGTTQDMNWERKGLRSEVVRNDAIFQHCRIQPLSADVKHPVTLKLYHLRKHPVRMDCSGTEICA
jgi:hypothetical protein